MNEHEFFINCFYDYDKENKIFDHIAVDAGQRRQLGAG